MIGRKSINLLSKDKKLSSVAILTAILFLIGFHTASAHFPDGVSFSGLGTAILDGVMSPGEWTNAGTIPFQVRVPEGGTTPGTIFIMNDNTTIYIALAFERPVIDAGNLIIVEFDNDHGGGNIVSGDDVLIFNGVTFRDATGRNVPQSDPSCITLNLVGSVCDVLDTSVGGSNDGAGIFTNNGTFSLFELRHPLNTVDDANDFSLQFSNTVGFALLVNLSNTTNIASTVFPFADLNAETFADINILELLIFTILTETGC